MSPRRRSQHKRGWPTHLYERDGYYSWRNPKTREEFGLGRNKASAFAQAVEANLHIEGLTNKPRLIDRLTGESVRTVETWLKKYAELQAARPLAENTRRSYASHARRIQLMFGAETPLRSISALSVSDSLEQLAKSGKERTAQAVASFLKESFRVAILHGWLDQNPVRDVRGGPVEVKRSRLSLETFLAVYNGTKIGWLKNAMALALVTAQRREDVAEAKFSDIRDGGWWVVQGKTGMRICLPLELRLDAFGMSLEEVIRQCRTTGVLSKHLVHQTSFFGKSPRGRAIWKDTVSRRFTDELRALGLVFEGKTPPTFHEIRSLSERLYSAQGGIDTQQLLGHTNAKTTALYHGARGDWVKLKVGERAG